MKSEMLFSGKNKKNLIKLLSAESAHSAVNVIVSFKIVADNIPKYVFPRK